MSGGEEGAWRTDHVPFGKSANVVNLNFFTLTPHTHSESHSAAPSLFDSSQFGAMVGLNERIRTLSLERKSDDERINTLRDLCDQQDGNIRDLIRQKDEISRAFEDYKRQQETMLKGIKEHAREREEEQARNIEESKRVLGQLRWALNVKQNVKGAQ